MTTPMLILDDQVWNYLDANGAICARHARVFQHDDGKMTAILTETPDSEGMSITTAAETIRRELARSYGEDVEVIEHYVPYADEAEHFDLVLPGGRWRRLSPELVRGLYRLPDPELGDRRS